VPELVNRPKVQHIWETIEKRIVPKLNHCITVSASIAEIYSKKYGIPFHLVRNVPARKHLSEKMPKESLPFPTNLPVILYQGAVNLGRGIEEAIQAMHQISNACLVIVGDGDLWNACNELVQNEGLGEKIFLTGKLPFEQLRIITPHATIGLSIEKDMGLNYRYALPNKLFDYIHAGVPVLSSSLPEIQNVMQTYDTGICIEEVTPTGIANAVKSLLENSDAMTRFKSNCLKASEELCWEHEEDTLKNIYSPLLYKK
jgi:glycosyltransferase involved in cell wall biosynthesis